MVKSVDSNMNKKSKKKKEEEIELPSKKTPLRDSRSHLRQYESTDLRGIAANFQLLYCFALPAQSYRTTSPSALAWSVTLAPPAGPT